MLNVCITCEATWCERCGGVVGAVPIPAFRCCHCLLAEYDTHGVLLPVRNEAANLDRLRI